MINRISTSKTNLDIIGEFFIEVEMNNANISEGYHEVQSYSVPGLKAENIFCLLFTLSDYDSGSYFGYIRYTSVPSFFKTSTGSASLNSKYVVVDGNVSFGYDMLSSLTEGDPITKIKFLGVAYKI